MIIMTGSSGGIGQAILPSLSNLDSVLALYHMKKPDVSGLSNVTSFKLDLTSESEIANFIGKMEKEFSNITLIHAAVFNRDALAVNVNPLDWTRALSINLGGDFLLSRAMLQPMIEEKWGRIIHISSVAAIKGVAGTLAYSTTKTGLHGMSRVMANEYARFGITSNVLVLGYFNIGLIETLNEKVRNKIIESIPSKCLGDSANIVNAIEFIIKSDYVNGAEIHIDGGI